MTDPQTDRMEEFVAGVRRAADNPEHIWDRRAIVWPLTKQSVVIEVGGYTGRWALQIAERYHPRLFVFEPQPWAAAVCRAVLGDAAYVFNFALGTKSETVSMAGWETDGCSLVKTDAVHPVDMREMAPLFRHLEVDHIDLMLMNIEGYEYMLLPYMLDHGILPDRLMVQFHQFDDPYGIGVARFHEWLENLGYRVVWTYGIVLTAWERS